MHDDSKALVSVIVPIYNTEKFLDQCLSSIEAQTYKNFEVLCINDGSTDGSRDIILAHAERDPRIKLVDKENGGYGQGCNLGLSLAKGEWVSIIEPDDWIEPGMYADMLSFAASFDETIDIVKTPWIDIHDWDDPKREKPYPCLMSDRIKKSSPKPFTLTEMPILIEMHPSIWSAIYRSEFIKEHAIRFPEYPGAGWADNPFLVETMCQAKAIVYLNKAYYNYRIDLPGSTIRHKSEEATSRPFDRWEDMLAVIKRIGIEDERVIAAHYVRGFNYIRGANFDDGRDNPIVARRTRDVITAMDPKIVATSDEISPYYKKFYDEVMGKRIAGTDSTMRYYLDELSFTLKHDGLLPLLRHAVNHFLRAVTRDSEFDLWRQRERKRADKRDGK